MVSLIIFIVLLETAKSRYKSVNPMTSFDSGIACISITLFGSTVDVTGNVVDNIAKKVDSVGLNEKELIEVLQL